MKEVAAAPPRPQGSKPPGQPFASPQTGRALLAQVGRGDLGAGKDRSPLSCLPRKPTGGGGRRRYRGEYRRPLAGNMGERSSSLRPRTWEFDQISRPDGYTRQPANRSVAGKSCMMEKCNL